MEVVDDFLVRLHVLRLQIGLLCESHQLVRQLAIRIAPGVHIMNKRHALRAQYTQIRFHVRKAAIRKVVRCVGCGLRLSRSDLQLLSDSPLGGFQCLQKLVHKKKE